MESEFKISIWAGLILLAIVACFTGSCSYINYIDDKAISDMVAKGANPIEAGCAITMNSGSGTSSTHMALCAGQRRN